MRSADIRMQRAGPKFGYVVRCKRVTLSLQVFATQLFYFQLSRV